MRKARVALVKGDDRYRNVSGALNLLDDDVDLRGRNLVLIKVNFVSTVNQLASTHVDAVRAVLDFIRNRKGYGGPIVVAEGAALSDTYEGFRNFGYLPLVEEYDVLLMDLNRDEWVEVELLDGRLRPMKLRVARTVVESDFRVSVGPPKTHDTVVVTLSLKNIAVGSLIRDQSRRSEAMGWLRKVTPSWVSESALYERLKASVANAINRNDKVAIHQGYPAINLNLCRLAHFVAPHLAVLDGYEAMEGNGPTAGTPVPWRIAIAGTDFLAVDSLTAYLMGFDPEQIGYLHYCKLAGLGVGDLDRIEVVGNASPEEVRRPFKPHSSYRRQLNWRIPDPERYLNPNAVRRASAES